MNYMGCNNRKPNLETIGIKSFTRVDILIHKGIRKQTNPNKSGNLEI